MNARHHSRHELASFTENRYLNNLTENCMLKQLNNEHRIYIARATLSLGKWLTFLATALIINDRYGVEHIAFTMAIQAIPSILVAIGAKRLLPAKHAGTMLVILYCLLALNAAAIAVNTNLIHLYFFITVSSFLSACVEPIFLGLIPQWVSQDRTKAVYTRLSAIQSMLLAIAPIIGASVFTWMGESYLFLLDACAYGIALIALPLTHGLSVDFQKDHNQTKSVKELSPALKRTLLMWSAMSLFGATFNGIEFFIFSEQNFSPNQIGILLCAWGVGSAFAFRFELRSSFVVSVGIYVFALCLGAILPRFYVLLGAFFLASIFSASATGIIRTTVNDLAQDYSNTLTIWSKYTLVLSLCNVIAYCCTAFMIRHPMVYPAFLVPIVGAGFLLLIFAQGSKLQAKI